MIAGLQKCGLIDTYQLVYYNSFKENQYKEIIIIKYRKTYKNLEMPINYALGKIYRLDCEGLTYIGSTSQPTLAQRLAGHRKDWFYESAKKNCSSKPLFDLGDPIITLIENYPCSNRDELHMRERYWYEQIQCINARKPYSSDEEKKINKAECDKKYRESHKEEKAKQDKEYREANIEHIKEVKKSITKKIKKYYLKNIIKIMNRTKINSYKSKKKGMKRIKIKSYSSVKNIEKLILNI